MKILKCGIASVQDQGRTGLRNMGITAGGVMDGQSAFLCNMLVANEPGDALIEILGGEWISSFGHPKLIAVGGKGYRVFAGEEPLPLWQPHFLPAGVAIRIQPEAGAGIAYFAIHGGIRIAPVLGSRATHVSAGFGGFEGRPLKASDDFPSAVLRTPFAQKIVDRLLSGGQRHFRLAPSVIPAFGQEKIRFVAGREADWFGDHVMGTLENSRFELTPISNRIGYRFKGIALMLEHPQQLCSTSVLPGTMQVSSDGQLLILMAEAQTTGGYPRIGQVIQRDLPVLAHRTAGSRIAFESVTMEAAEKLFLQQQTQLALLKKDYSLLF